MGQWNLICRSTTLEETQLLVCNNCLTMKSAVIITILVCVVSPIFCQDVFNCDDCAASTNNRNNETGCNGFCVIDLNGNNLMERSELETLINGTKNENGTVERATFVPVFTTATGLCEAEGDAGFDVIASLGLGDPDVIEDADVETLWETVIDPEGKGAVGKSEWLESWNAFYEVIVDETCEA